MSDCRFVCHNCCYNAPLATLVFAILFCLHVTLVPVIERRLIQQLHARGPASRAHHTGLEFIHGIIAWLCVLAVYLVISQLAKMKVDRSDHRSTTPPSIYQQYTIHPCEVDK